MIIAPCKCLKWWAIPGVYLGYTWGFFWSFFKVFWTRGLGLNSFSILYNLVSITLPPFKYLCLVLLQVPKYFGLVQIFCARPKIDIKILWQSQKNLCRTKRWFPFSKFGFCAITQVFEEALRPGICVKYFLSFPQKNLSPETKNRCQITPLSIFSFGDLFGTLKFNGAFTDLFWTQFQNLWLSEIKPPLSRRFWNRVQNRSVNAPLNSSVPNKCKDSLHDFCSALWQVPF